MNKISVNSKNYPSKLSNLADPPTQIFVDGDLNIFKAPSLAVVGSRKVSNYGHSVTEKIVREIAARGVVIVSGLAFGVDSIAHKAALAVGGKTIAVLPSSIDSIYPKSHSGLAVEIVKNGGCLVSEYPPKTAIFNHNFIARNRIIAALGDFLLITEAAERSGSLHTAGFALDLGKDIFAVPGPIDNINCIGSNNLIKAGAKPCTSSSDILDALGLSAIEKREIIAANKDEFVILDLINQGIIDDDEIQTKCNLTPLVYQQTISMLELTGRISPLGNGKWRLT